MSTVTDKILEVRRPKPDYKVINEIANRWSPRFFSDEAVSTNDLKIIFEAARWTPSAHNAQPWYFYYAHKGSASYEKLFSSLNQHNQSWARTAPLLILACAIIKNSHGINRFAFYDLGAAVICLILQAQHLGYYSRQMGLFDKEKVKKILRLPETFEPYIIIAMGRLGNYEKAPQEIINREFEPKPKKKDFYRKV